MEERNPISFTVRRRRFGRSWVVENREDIRVKRKR
ncbi:hypothetical protein SLEP1_g46146 [Rubroshorea leprosula]|uniref:Uncharacterized protein n=1 Tax=Rubroshorea leprosula TaxID=152421 RepID=A0AAV5LLB3_9ROSI|nr:hypothetical protein SLEP1_g46146 [Rubroshorea leprosula]